MNEAIRLETSHEAIWAAGKYPKNVRARSLFRYWAVRELGWSTTEIARRMGMTQPGVSISAGRGERVSVKTGMKINDI